MPDMIFIYITAKDGPEAKRIAKKLLEQRLIACANIFPINSMYWWQNKIVDESEYVVICKTKKEKYGRIIECVKKIHSYSIPCITRIDVFPNTEYMEWLESEVSDARQ